MKTRMFTRAPWLVLCLMALLVAGCTGPAEDPDPTAEAPPAPSAAPDATATPPVDPTTAPPDEPTATPPNESSPTAQATAEEGEGGAGGRNTPEADTTPGVTPELVATITVPPEGRPPEAQLILSPLPGAFVNSPLVIQGEADAAFEQTVIVRVITAEGDELFLEPVTIAADVGQRGPVNLEVPFSVEMPTQAMVQMYSESPMDGEIDHLSSVFVVLAPPDIPPSEGETIEGADLEKVWIESPVNGETISGGTVSVSGVGLASFEQTLVATLTADDGTLLGEAIITVQSAELGQAGPFSAEIAYEIASPQTARLTVRDDSPVLNEAAHLTSVIVNLEP